MIIKKGLLVLFLYMLTSLVLHAQLALNLSDVSSEQGQTVEVDLSISGFSEIISMQFSVNWDSTVLDFKSVDDITDALPTFSDKEIGIAEVSSGVLRIVWFDNTLAGISVPDDTKLFKLTFQLIGGEGTNSSITISDSPIVIEFTTVDGNAVELAEVTGGMVSIPDIPSSTFLIAPNGMELYQNEPNPFHSITSIKAMLPSAEDVQFFVTDISGKIVYQNNFKSVQGENTIEIRSDLLATSGTYYYTLQSEHYQLSRKLILLP